MASLISKNNITHILQCDPDWYFTDAWFDYRADSYNNRAWKFKIEKTYPFIRYIHNDCFNENNIIKIDIREFIEMSCKYDCFYEVKTMNYKYRYKNKNNIVESYIYSYDNSFDVKHGYHAFYFKCEEDAVAFHLRFSDIVTSQVSLRHPDKTHVTEDMICNY